MPRHRAVLASVLVLAAVLLSPSIVYAQSSNSSQAVTWTCTGSPCPWGGSLSGQALVWPAQLGPVTNRLGYTTSAGVYLPANAAAGMTISITSGAAGVYAGQPGGGSHRLLAALSAGQAYLVAGLAADEVVSVQADQAPFGYALAAPAAPTATPLPTETATALPTATPLPTETAMPAYCADPMACNPVASTKAFWRCNINGCMDPDWIGAVIYWPAWAAYDTNARAGNQSRTVYSEQGERLYPYMGSWANGCQVTSLTGTVLIIEWKRGTDQWRETYLAPGETHTITLLPGEDGAMIEAPATGPFAVSLANCNPQPLAVTEAASQIPTPAAPAAAKVDADGEAGNNNSQLFLPLINP